MVMVLAQNIEVSVRSLVEYVYLSGSIIAGFRGSTSLAEGTRIHQRIQGEQGEHYEKEVYLRAEMAYNGLLYKIDGRCDGIYHGEETVIEEIKSTRKDLDGIKEDSYPVHWAQAKVYGYIYASQNNLEKIGIQLTYASAADDRLKSFKKNYCVTELKKYLEYLLKDYSELVMERVNFQAKKISSIKELPFPFAQYREGQRDLAKAVYKTLMDDKRLFAKAPTGIGKTISTIFPAVKAMGEGAVERILYLTAKTITRTVAEDTFSLLREKGLKMKVSTITAKEKICFKDEAICSPDACEFSEGYYDRLKPALLDLYRNEDTFSRTEIEHYARKHRLCPFEFSLDAALLADAIICDYNYVFDPKVSLKRLSEENKKSYAVLIDEAHNLVDRGRAMYSAQIRKSSFLELKRALVQDSTGLLDISKELNEYLLGMKKENLSVESVKVDKEKPKELLKLLANFSSAADAWLSSNNGHPTYQLVLDAYFETSNFIKIGKLYDERFACVMDRFKSEVRVKLFCLDPSRLLKEITNKNKGTIFFSATLEPLDYYKEMLGGEREDYGIKLSSPFDRENLQVKIKSLSTKYRDREKTSGSIAQTIQEVVSKNPGNYLVFFPSYQYMNIVYQIFHENFPEIQSIVQESAMDEREREKFLEEFQEDTGHTLVGFAVLGGIFSEGIDLKGDRLNGVIVIGVGLPQIGLEPDIIKDYFNEVSGRGYDYAYTLPGMNKVMQAGGRLIRTEEDKGILVLIDDRFLTPKYQKLLPNEWKHYTVY